MIVVMEAGVSQQIIDQVVERLREFGFDVHLSQGVERTVIGAIGEKTAQKIQQLEAMTGVEKIVPILQPYKLAGKEFKQERSQVQVAGVVFGGAQVPVIAGPCAVESREQILETARLVKAAGASLLRGGAYKPRTSPYSFQGLAEEGLKLLAEAREETGLGVVTEVVNPRDVETVAQYVDMFQIGARNMQNFELLKEVGSVKKPVLLKRGLAATIEEFMNAAEYIASRGNDQIMLCERGIRTYERATRNTLDISAVPILKQETHLPVIVDVTHSTGRRDLLLPTAKAALAIGADAVMVEVHPDPAVALSDSNQQMDIPQFENFMNELRTSGLYKDVTKPSAL